MGPNTQLNATTGTGMVRSVTVTGDQIHPDSVQLEVYLDLDDPLGAGTYPRTVVVSSTAPQQFFAAMASVASWACAAGAPVDVSWQPNAGLADRLTALTVHGPDADDEETDGRFAES